MPRSSSGPGHLPFTEKITGSNPVRGTKTQKMRLNFTIIHSHFYFGTVCFKSKTIGNHLLKLINIHCFY
jgi:hypothetical protein